MDRVNFTYFLCEFNRILDIKIIKNQHHNKNILYSILLSSYYYRTHFPFKIRLLLLKSPMKELVLLILILTQVSSFLDYNEDHILVCPNINMSLNFNQSLESLWYFTSYAGILSFYIQSIVSCF